MRRLPIPALAVLLLLCVAPLAGCASDGELARAIEAEEQAEAILERALDLPEDLEGRDETVARARAEEAELEAIRKDLQDLSQRSLIEKGLDVAGDAASGDFIGGATTLMGAALTAVTLWIRKRNREELEAEREQTRRDLEDLEQRRDASRAAVNLPPGNADPETIWYGQPDPAAGYYGSDRFRYPPAPPQQGEGA